MHLQRFHEDALVLANGYQIGGLADHAVAARAPTVLSVGIEQGTGAVHAAFLVGRYQQAHGCGQFFGRVFAGHGGGDRDEAFHVTGAQAVESTIALGQAKGVAVPAVIVIGHGIDMSGEHQAVFTGRVVSAQACDEVHLVVAVGHGGDRAGKTGLLEPIGQVFDGGAIAAIEVRIVAADGAMADQRGERLLPVEYGHMRFYRGPAPGLSSSEHRMVYRRFET